jgi:hypothetical protein
MRPYTDVDTLIARVQSDAIIVSMNVVNYLANMLFLSAMLIAGFKRAELDGYICIFAAPMVVFLFSMFLYTHGKGTVLQDSRTFFFLTKYCNADGSLKPQYLKKAHKSKDLLKE